jgi:hypothetical protein
MDKESTGVIVIPLGIPISWTVGNLWENWDSARNYHLIYEKSAKGR